MSTQAPTRTPPPDAHVEPLRPQAPPQRRGGDRGLGALTALPMLGSLGSVVLVAGLGGEHRARGLMAAGLILCATVGFLAVQVDRQRRQRAGDDATSREAYRHHLAAVRRSARAAAASRRSELLRRFPPPEALPLRVAGLASRWPPSSDHGGADPLLVRYGEAPAASMPAVAPPDDDGAGAPDPVSAAALARLVAAHGASSELPATADLRRCRRLEICGEEGPARDLARAVVCSAAARHPPSRLAVAVLAAPEVVALWEWVKWLPHAASPRRADRLGPERMVATDPAELTALAPEDAAAHLLVVVDGQPVPHPALADRPGLTVIDLPASWGVPSSSDGLRLELPGPADAAPDPARDAPVVAVRPGEEPRVGRADRCGPALAEAVARRLAPAAPAGGARRTDGSPDPVATLGLDAVLRPTGGSPWSEPGALAPLRVALGTDGGGDPVTLDLAEAAAGGDGPHGLLVGATGSGKSELLRTLVLGLAAAHPPEALTLALVDFKGGATFAPLAGLPHVAALITNLAAESALVDRMRDALSGELARRQEVLHRSGFASRREHEAARAGGADLDPLPSLVVVVDEFAELLGAHPEFLDVFVAVGRLGRSLGLHLLLSSQRLDEGRLRGLEAHLSYRIGLRTFSASESRAAIGIPDAADLPNTPGVGYLRTGPGEPRRFRAAHISVAGPGTRNVAPARRARVLPFQAAPLAHPDPEVPPASVDEASLIDAVVARLSGAAPRARPIWLPPLDASPSLGSVLTEVGRDHDLGLVSRGWRDRGPLVLPLGTVDLPREQRRETLTVDLAGARGHLAVVGGPRSGTSSFLATTVSALALTSTPVEAQVLLLDLDGGTCASLGGLPHVAGVATRAEPHAVRRALARATSLLDERAALFRAHGIASVAEYRQRRSRGEVDDGWGDVFVVVDGWAALLAEPAPGDPAGGAASEREAAVRRLATEGLTYGVHLVVAASRWSELRPGIRDAFGSRLELRLGNPLDSETDRHAAARVPSDRPGRGLTPHGHHFLTARPALDEGAGLGGLVAASAGAWQGPAAPQLRHLPTSADLGALRRRWREEGGPEHHLLLGVAEEDLAPVALDPRRDRHLLVLGEAGSGKTAALRAYADEVCRTHGPEEAQLVAVDYRRTLLGEIDPAYLLDHLAGTATAGPALADLAGHLEQRLPGPDVTPAQLRDRSWWQGPDVFVLVDDYDLVATGRDSPVLALEHLLAQAADIGLHLVVARRSGGAARALHEPVTQTLRDLATPGLLLSGNPDEGPLLGGRRPSPAPPGRARLFTRDEGERTLQLAWRAPRAGGVAPHR